MLNIGIAGYYGNNEVCDDLLEYAIKKEIGKHIDAKWTRLDYGIPSYIGEFSRFDFIILGGGSLLGLPFPMLVNDLKQTDCQFYIFGTGFREMHNFSHLKYLWDRASLIAVRGSTSIKRLDNHGLDTSRIEVLGDPIFLLEPRPKREPEYVGGVMRSKLLNYRRMDAIFNYLRFNEKKAIRLFSFCDRQGDLTPREHGYQVESVNIANANEKVARSSFWFGNRLHPFCLALINSIPTIGLEIEFRKIEDVCVVLDYPYWLREADLSDFDELYNRLIGNWSETSKKLSFQINQTREYLQEFAKKIVEEVEV